MAPFVVTMIHANDYDNRIVLLDSISLRDLLLDESLADKLVSLGLQRSCDLWVLALGELISLHHGFSNLLRRISQDFDEQRGLGEDSQYEARIEFPSAQITDKMDNTFSPTVAKHPTESTTVRLSLSMKTSRYAKVCWEALLLDSYLSQDRSSALCNDKDNRVFCLYFLSKARGGDIKIKHWAEPPVNNWQALLLKPTTDIFVDWLHSTKFSQRDLNIFEERMGLISGQRKTLEEIGQEFGITRERVRQITSRFLKHLSHPIRRKQLTPFGFYLKKLLQRRGGIMTLEEISRSGYSTVDFECFSPLPVIELILHCHGMFSALEYDYESGRGSSDIGSVTWHLREIEPEAISVTRKLAVTFVDKDPCKYSFEELVAIVSAESDVPIEITRASLRTYELIEQDSDGLMVRTGKTKYLTVSAMALIVLREIGVPSHFTVIAEKINNRFPERNLKSRDVHSRLGSPLFRWVDRGTYGLAEWGLPEIRPKENYAAAKKAIRMVLQDIGRPATIREIDEYFDVMKAQDQSFMLLSRTSVILNSNPQLFVSFGLGKWGLVEWNIPRRLPKDTVSLTCEILTEDETAWLTVQQLYMEMKSRGWIAPIVAVQRALDREVAKPKRHIRREELHGFYIQLYGLSSRDWNEEAVLNRLLAD